MPQGFFPVDPSLYNLSREDLSFLRLLTGITDDEELKQHVLAIQAKAYEICPYPCIRHFTFAKQPITRIPYYERVLAFGRENPDALFLDLGCCFGSDLRKVVHDGWPVNRAIGSDLIPGKHAYTHSLYPKI
ncbi:hypothetical protein NP233_g13106 [Leucocoprinus birnbaumii]|uniref:Methyltransferase n=1 Tax=Leucocoprinus birnbaumii TaxID=56174 RepID=A0AAD5YJT1_9AGAR|nr:hypothetical protein NP233_g13106 [Leucocoprinus birnbaumii]